MVLICPPQLKKHAFHAGLWTFDGWKIADEEALWWINHVLIAIEYCAMLGLPSAPWTIYQVQMTLDVHRSYFS